MEDYLIFMEVAESDLKAARVLWENKLYPQAVFYLEQSVEKANKSYLLWIGTASSDDMKKIGHSFQKFCKMLVFTESIVPEALEKMIEEKIKNKRIRGEVKKMIRATIKMMWKTPPTVDICDKIEEEKFSLTYTDNIINTFKSLKDKSIKELVILSHVQQAYPTPKEGLTTIIVGLIHSLVFLSPLFLDLAPHAVRSRYPVDGSNPLEVYNEKMPLVQKFEPLLEIAEYSLNNLKNINSISYHIPYVDEIRKYIRKYVEERKLKWDC